MSESTGTGTDELTAIDGCVVQQWVRELSFKQQTVLLSAIRGCDGTPKNDPHKQFVRPLRATILRDAEPNTESTFMTHPDGETVDKFAHRLDDYPMHWLVHFIHAVEIIGYKHPDDDEREWWFDLYEELVDEGFHLNIESEVELDKRLSDGVESGSNQGDTS